ncbi:MAG: two-component system sensor histidine kinase NtrB [Thermoanaerobaculia bacterium]
MTLQRLLLAFALVIFVASAIILIATVPRLYLLATARNRAAESAIADVCAAELSLVVPADKVTFATRSGELRRRYPGVTIEALNSGLTRVMSPDEDVTAVSEHSEVRQSGGRAILVRFQTAGIGPVGRLIRTAAAAGTVAGVTSIALAILSLYAYGRAPRTRRPLASGSGDSSAYLFETFQTSIKTLKGRENELRRLHDQAQERANELATMTATLVRSLTSGFIAFDESGVIVDMNQAAKDLTGVSPGTEAKGTRVVQLLGDTPFANALDKAITERSALQRVEVAGTRDGEQTLIGLSTVALSDPSGRYLGMLALFTDLTPVRRLETRMREIQSLADLGEMSSGIAHEFRNSLSTVLGYLRLAKKSALPPDALERVDRAEEEANQLSQAVESLLVFARPISLSKQQVDVTALASEIAERLLSLERGIDLVCEGEPIVIEGDASLLGRAIENIVRNGIDAIRQSGKQSGTITIRSDARRTPTLTIMDNGIGMSETDANKAFVPFHSTKPNGFGLGLAIARKMIVLHGGTIRIMTGPGEGASFLLEFGEAT